MIQDNQEGPGRVDVCRKEQRGFVRKIKGSGKVVTVRR